MTGVDTEAEPPLSQCDLFGRAAGLIETVRAHSTLAEELRQLSDPVVEALRTAGVHRVLQPKHHGGAEAHFSNMVDIVETVSRGCTAAGWCLTQYASHNCLLGYFPPKGQEDIWMQTPDALVAGVLIPGCGTARRVEGGWRVTGQWPFASGVHGADWFIAAAFAEGGERETVAQMHVLPRGEFEILDTWHTAGLRGTGSADVVVTDRFVPEHRALPIALTKGGGDAPGCQVSASALYRLPAFAMFSINQSAVALGLAQAILDAFLEQARTRVARSSGKTIADYSTAQVKVAEADTAIKTARLLLHDCCNRGMTVAESGHSAAMVIKTELRAKATLAGRLSAEAVDLLFQLSGGAGIYDRNPISRGMRDMSCIRGHITQNWDVNASNHGRVLLGLPSADPAL